VYAHDPRDRKKQEQAFRLLDSLVSSGRAVLSVQCLTEFFSVTTLRLPEPLEQAVAMAQVERLIRSCRVLDLTPAVVLEGCRGSREYALPIWDALIWAVGKLNQIGYILTEDAEHERFLEGVRFLNPFHPAFDLADLERSG
jgi:predicted nucleic acid-binding protein